MLSQSGVVRADIRSSFGAYSGTAAGVPLTIKLAIQDLANGCAPLAKAAVYVWHCDRDGNYSLYSQAASSQNYLRGVQEAGADGIATFQSIFPACYSGRWPHIHFEVYPNLAAATDDANKIATSQIALPKDTCDAVYATDGYAQSVRNLQAGQPDQRHGLRRRWRRPRDRDGQRQPQLRLHRHAGGAGQDRLTGPASGPATEP